MAPSRESSGQQAPARAASSPTRTAPASQVPKPPLACCWAWCHQVWACGLKLRAIALQTRLQLKGARDATRSFPGRRSFKVNTHWTGADVSHRYLASRTTTSRTSCSSLAPRAAGGTTSSFKTFACFLATQLQGHHAPQSESARRYLAFRTTASPSSHYAASCRYSFKVSAQARQSQRQGGHRLNQSAASRSSSAARGGLGTASQPPCKV